MMKFGILLVAILHTSLSAPPAAPAPKETLGDRLFKTISLDKVKEIADKHFKEDAGYQAAVIELKSSKFQKLVEEVHNNPAWIAYKSFLKDQEIDLDRVIAHIQHCLNATDTSQLHPGNAKPDLSNFIQDLKTNIVEAVVKSIGNMKEKISADEDLKKKAEQLISEKSKNLLEKALAEPALKKLQAELKELGVDTESTVALIYVLSGWKSDLTTKASP